MLSEHCKPHAVTGPDFARPALQKLREIQHIGLEGVIIKPTPTQWIPQSYPCTKLPIPEATLRRLLLLIILQVVIAIDHSLGQKWEAHGNQHQGGGKDEHVIFAFQYDQSSCSSQ